MKARDCRWGTGNMEIPRKVHLADGRVETVHVVGRVASIAEEDGILILTRPTADTPDVVSKVRDELHWGPMGWRHQCGARDGLLRRLT